MTILNQSIFHTDTCTCTFCNRMTDRQSYLQQATGLGSTTPAVYNAMNKPRWWTLRVISRITQTNRMTDRQSYLQHATGLGSTTPAVYTAWNKPRWWTLRVISRIKTGATLFRPEFLVNTEKINFYHMFFSAMERVKLVH